MLRRGGGLTSVRSARRLPATVVVSLKGRYICIAVEGDLSWVLPERV